MTKTKAQSWIQLLAAGLTALSISTTASADLLVSYVEVKAQDSYQSNRVYAGQTVASRASQLGFNTGGEIESVQIDIGQRVEAGDQLATLDTRRLQATLKQATADVQLAKANVEVLKAQTRLALNTARRVQDLQSGGHISEQGLDEARLTAQARGAELEVAKARLENALARQEIVKVSLDEAHIKAPFAGVIQARYVDEGAQVQPGQPVLRIVEDHLLEAHIGIPDKAVEGLREGSTHQFVIAGRTLTGQLSGLLPEVDPSSRTQTAIFSIEPGNAGPLPIGASIELLLGDEVRSPGYWLPVSSLTASDRGLWGVYVINPSNIIEKRLVEVIHTESDRVFVRGTLQGGERVVDSGVQRLVPGQQVTAELVAGRE